MPDTKKFPQPATAPDGLANALPDVPVCDPDCHGEPDIVARLRSDLPDDEVEWINDRLEKEGTGELPEEKPELSNLVIELPPKGETK